jgi:transcriptional regulator with XRE-family HTH domain
VNTIAEALSARRAALGMTQDAFAAFVGVSPSQLGHYESGENAPTAASLKKIALALGWTARQIGELILGSSYPERKNRPRPLRKVAA